MTQGPESQHPYQPPYPQQGSPQQPPYGSGQPATPSGWNPQGGYASGPPTTGWGTQAGYPSGQQGYPATQQGYPSGQQGYPAGQQGYPASQQGYPTGQQGYPQPQAAPYGKQAAQNSPLLGMIALGGVAVCGVVLCWLMWRMGAMVGPLAVASGGSMTQAELTQALTEQLGGSGILALNVAGYGGIAAWITGIVATATRRGRSYGVWAIILGILAPVVAIIMMVAAMMPYIS